MNQKIFTWGLAASVWALNPVITGCDPSGDKEFTFGESEMLDLLDELNEQSWSIEFEGAMVEVLVEIEQIQEETSAALSLPSNSAYACGSRSFIASAEACIDTTSLPIEGTISILDDESEEPETFLVSGSIEVMGHYLDNADIWIYNDDIRAGWGGLMDEESNQLSLIMSTLER